jgi:hypothetical protein
MLQLCLFHHKVPLRISANPLTIRYGDPPPNFCDNDRTPRHRYPQTQCNIRRRALMRRAHRIGTIYHVPSRRFQRRITMPIFRTRRCADGRAHRANGHRVSGQRSGIQRFALYLSAEVPAGATATVDVLPLHAGVFTLTATVVETIIFPKPCRQLLSSIPRYLVWS